MIMTESTKKEIIFIDMDGVLVDFESGVEKIAPEVKAKYEDDGTGKHQYKNIPGMFSLMEPMPGAIDAIKALHASGRFELYILSCAPWNNPSSWTDKLEWVKKHLDSAKSDGIFYKRIVLSHHKNLCAQNNAWLIDDRIAHGSELFGEHFIHFGSERFPDWNAVLAHFNV